MSSILRTTSLVLIVTAIGFLGAAAPAGAATLTVCGTGCDATTIQAAIDAADPEDLITVAAGTWTGSLYVDKALTIRGARGAVDGRSRTPDAGDTTIVGDAASPVIVADGANLQLDGVVLQSTSPGLTDAAIDSDDELVLHDSMILGASVGIEVLGSGTELVEVRRSRIDYAEVGLDVDTVGILDVGDAHLRSTSTGSYAIRSEDAVSFSLTGSRIEPAIDSGIHRGIYLLGGGSSTAIADTALLRLGPALDVDSDVTGTVTIRRTRIERRSSSADSINVDRAAAVDVADVWFDCEGTPAVSGTCDVLAPASNVNLLSWLVPSMALASGLRSGATSTISVAMTRNDGTAPPALPALEGTPVSFSSSRSVGDSFTPVATSLAANAASTAWTPATPGTLSLSALVDGIRRTVAVTIVDPAPVASAAPVLRGVVRRGSVVTCTTGTWPGQGGSFAATWRRNGVAIAGATSQTYVPTSRDVGTRLSCTQTLTRTSTHPGVASSRPAVVAKGILRLELRQTHPNGSPQPCGTTRKPCSVARGAALLLSVRPHPSVSKGLRVSVVLEQRVGSRWVAMRPVTRTLGAKPFSVPTRGLAAGTWRVRVSTPATRFDHAARSGYRVLVLR